MNFNNNNYMFPKKSELRKIEISSINVDLPDLKNTQTSKSVTIGKWIADWINKGLKEGFLKENDILPTKSDFAYMLGVSTGTIQNAMRYIEDIGYVESKQCIGTLIKGKNYNQPSLRKLTSKKDFATDAIKEYIIKEGYKVGDRLPSSGNISAAIGYTTNTTRLALETLTSQSILSHPHKTSRQSAWIIKTIDFDITESAKNKKATTLVDMVVKDLEKYINDNLKIGDRIPSHNELTHILKASLKTVHDALQILVNRGILLSRRGRYGTTVIKTTDSAIYNSKPETSIFAPAKDTAFYHYEKTQNHIKRLIAQNYEIGDKIPSITELSKTLDLSPNTIRKALHNLAKEGYLVFSRGRYGGTFVIDIPEVDTQAFKWLAVNPQFAKEYSN